MPTYEYKCTKCERRFDLFQLITASPKRFIDTECSQCNNRAPVKRCIGMGGGIIFKGSGFYQTDYRSENYKKAAEADKKPGNNKSSGDKSSGDTKSDKSGKKTEKKKESKLPKKESSTVSE